MSELLIDQRRINAALTVCNGIPTEILERSKMTPPEIPYQDLLAQRDRLVEALKEIMQRTNESTPDLLSHLGIIHDVYGIANKALSEIEAG